MMPYLRTLALAVVASIAWAEAPLDTSWIGAAVVWTVTAAGISSAMFTIAAARLLPGLVRLTATAAALYALGTMAAAVAQGTSYADWLRQDTRWWWLPGGVVGAFVVMPVGILLHLLKTAGPRWRTAGAVSRDFNRAVALTLCVVTAVAHIPAADTPRPSERRTANSAQSTPKTPSPLPLPEAPSLNPVDLLTQADEMSQRAVAAEWQVEAKADALDDRVEAAFTFVRDAIGFDAYAGVMRGAQGTYASRAGNAADRSLLLAALLTRKHIPTRFAIGTLTHGELERLFARAFDLDPSAERIADRTKRLAPDGRAFHERVFARANRDYHSVRQALGDRLRPVTSPSRSDVLSEMNPHVWVQANVNGTWIDLDPSFPDAVVGKASASLEQTVEHLPEQLFQRVRVRLFAEYLANGALVTSTLLDLTRTTVDWLDAQVFLIHTDTDPGNPMGGLGTALRRALGNRDSLWTPLLSVDGEFFTGIPVNVSPSQRAFVAEWVEFELTWPNGRTEVTRRALVDRGGEAWRAVDRLDATALRPLEVNDHGPRAMQAIHNIWFAAGKHNLVDVAQGMRYVAATAVLQLPPPDQGDPNGSDGFSSMPATAFPEDLFPFALQNLSWLVWTDHVVIPSLNGTQGVRLYSDGARIAMFSAQAHEDEVEIVSDLRRDHLRALVRHANDRLAVAEKKLWFGVAQGALEQEALADLMVANGGDPLLVETTSSRHTRGDLIVLGPADAPMMTAHPASRARLSSALMTGRIVVAPVDALDEQGAWWEIAAETGETRAVSQLDLNGGRTRFKPPGNPLRTRVTPQTNPYGGPRVYEIDPRTLNSVRTQAGAARSQARAIVRSPKGPPEYSLLRAAIGAVVVGALIILGTMVAIRVFAASEALSAPE